MNVDQTADDADLIGLPLQVFETKPVPAIDTGNQGDLSWIALDDLAIDPRYQRQVLERGRRNIKFIVENFSWARFSPLVVRRRTNGKFAVIDGQHRAIAARCHGGIPKLPCMVINCDDEEEAIAFATINGQVTAVLPTQIFYASLAGGDRKALELKNICDCAGVAILRNPKPKPRAGETSAVGTLETCLKKFGRATLITALQCITETNDGNPGYLNSPIIQAACEVLHRHPKWCDAGEELFKAVETISIPHLYALAQSRRDTKGVPVRKLFAEAFTEVLTRELGLIGKPTWKPGAGAAPISLEKLSDNLCDVLLALSSYSLPVTSAEVILLVDASPERVPGLLTKLSQLGCARVAAGRWELTGVGRATAEQARQRGDVALAEITA